MLRSIISLLVSYEDMAHQRASRFEMVSATNPCGFCMIAWESKQLGGLDTPGGIPEEGSVVNARSSSMICSLWLYKICNVSVFNS